MKTSYPKNPAKDFNEWQDHIRKTPEDLATDKFEAEFMRIWLQFKQSLIKK